jgi:hypothetical protein
MVLIVLPDIHFVLIRSENVWLECELAERSEKAWQTGG